MTTNTVVVLLIGTCAMLVPILILMMCYRVSLWKGFPASFILTVTGTVGTYIWFIVENGGFGGRSFYGAVFLVPPAFWFVAKYLKISFGELMDFCGPAECVMLVIMKYKCMLDGCCGGKVIRIAEDGNAVVFPSQLAEMIAAASLFVVLMILAMIKANRGTIYPWYMILYGATRFVLNFFRAEQSAYFLGLPPGHVWSILSVVLGIIWIVIYRKKQKAIPSGEEIPKEV